MQFHRFDHFSNCPDGSYPDGWDLENHSANSNHLGECRNHRFALYYPGNRHIPKTPPLRDFELNVRLACDKIFSPAAISIFLRYDPKNETGLCLDYFWGKAGAPETNGQMEIPAYTVVLSLYNGKNKESHKRMVGKMSAAPFLHDLSQESLLKIILVGTWLKFYHNEILIGEFSCDWLEKGVVAFDRPVDCYVLELLSVEITGEAEGVEVVLTEEQTVEFSAGINGIISPVFYHWQFIARCGLPVLKVRITGGPPLKPRFPQLGRFSLGEVLESPYLRIENENGREIGKYYIRHGSMGLSREHWNIHCTVIPPAEYSYPAEAEFYLPELPENYRIIAGYESYFAEDSISSAGGPSEAVFTADGKLLHAGKALGTELSLISDPEKQITKDIPGDIPFYEKALGFARKNFFYCTAEPIRFKAVFTIRHLKLSVEELDGKLYLENAFQEVLSEFSISKWIHVPNSSGLSGVNIFESEFALAPQPPGIYHLCLDLTVGGARQTVRRAMEVMSGDLEHTPPVLSGLPALYSNIISGTCSEHFYPWSETVNDIMHYQTGGSLFLQVESDWQASRLLHVYGRPWLCWLARCCEAAFRPGGPENNRDVIADADYVADWGHRGDCWSIPHYSNPQLRGVLDKFLHSGNFQASSRLELTPENVSNDPRTPLTDAQFLDLVENHWKKWLFFLCSEYTKEALEYHKRLEDAGGKGFYSFCSPVYPTYASVYKSDYFLMFCGHDPRGFQPGSILKGPNGLEDYPYSSKYYISRGVFQLAALKLTFPDLPLNPEAFGVNGETADQHVTFAHPDYGVSSPPSGFYEKLFYEYSYGAVWFRDGAFYYWKDHGYHIRGWRTEHYADMFKAYSFICRTTPSAPLKSTGFVISLDSCLAHADFYEKDPGIFLGGYVMNTAEESVPFAYECARRDGQNAGFLTRTEDLKTLSAEHLSLLVLPPLKGVSESALNAIERLHKDGAALLVFEDPGRLERLFGVRHTEQTSRIRQITPVGRFAGMTEMETTDHPLCCSRLENMDGEVLLASNDGIPVLTMKKTPWGRTAIFHIPPSVVNRARDVYPSYGQQSLSMLMYKATALIQRELAPSPVQTTAGKTISFRDISDNIHIIVSEDSWPEKADRISPKLTIRIPDAGQRKLSVSIPYSLIEHSGEQISLRLQLEPHQSARILLEKEQGS